MVPANTALILGTIPLVTREAHNLRAAALGGKLPPFERRECQPEGLLDPFSVPSSGPLHRPIIWPHRDCRSAHSCRCAAASAAEHNPTLMSLCTSHYLIIRQKAYLKSYCLHVLFTPYIVHWSRSSRVPSPIVKGTGDTIGTAMMGW